MDKRIILASGSPRRREIMEQAGYTGVSVKKDLAGLDRVVFGVYDR